ncbi:MAG: cysteine dioxygenase [Pseudonocardiaceae bacterium]
MNVYDLTAAVGRIKARSERLPRHRVVDELSDALGSFVSDEDSKTFVEQLSPNGNYTRLLLNSPDDSFQIVLVLWGPGRGSPIHDHDGTVGVVSSIMGTTREIKYEVLQQRGQESVLARGDEILIAPTHVTPIFPEPDTQLHLMINDTSQWTATVHVYLDAIDRYRLYHQQSGNLYRSELTELWFDQVNVGKHITPMQQPVTTT